MTLGIAAFDAQLSSAALTSTKKKQEIIKDALIGYLRDNKRLPCPETTAIGGVAPTGQETRQTAGNPATLCTSYWGTVPYTTLGLTRDTAIDGFGNFYTYFVSSAQSTAEPDWTLTQNTAAVPGFSVGNPGRFGITDNGVATTLSANLAVAAIVSHGKNGLGAYTTKGTRNDQPTAGAEERTNAPDAAVVPGPWNPPSTIATASPDPGIAVIVSRDRTDTFDDIVLAIRPNDLLQPLIKDGAIKSAEAKVQEGLITVRDLGIEYFFNTSPTPCTPKAIPLAMLPIDAWGSAINYTYSLSPLTQANAATLASTTAFSIRSFGPDRANGGTDDRVLTVTYGQILARIPSTACPAS